MTSRNGAEPEATRADRVQRGEGNLSPAAVAWLTERTEAFQRATSGKGQPLTYGAGVPPKTQPKGKGTKDRKRG